MTYIRLVRAVSKHLYVAEFYVGTRGEAELTHTRTIELRELDRATGNRTKLRCKPNSRWGMVIPDSIGGIQSILAIGDEVAPKVLLVA